MPLRNDEAMHRYDRDDNYTFDRGRRGNEWERDRGADRGDRWEARLSERWPSDRGEYDRGQYDRGLEDRGYYGRENTGGYVGSKGDESYVDRDYGRGEYSRREYDRWNADRPENDRGRSTYGTGRSDSDYERDYGHGARGDGEPWDGWRWREDEPDDMQRMGHARSSFDRQYYPRESERDYDYNRSVLGDRGWRSGGGESGSTYRRTVDRPYPYNPGNERIGRSGGTGDVDAARRGRYAGVGPRGYRRSDDRIREDVSDRLARHPEINASDIDISVEDGIVTLSGTIETRWAKRAAEDEAEAVWGVKDVLNHLRISAGRTDMDTERSSQSTQSGRSHTGQITTAAAPAMTSGSTNTPTGAVNTPTPPPASGQRSRNRSTRATSTGEQADAA